ncbi:D-alanine--D-alanine ligase [Minicystis rosea]|nr:D-alanine--D-alanine ligase [Minicystis rosea]
MSQEKKVRVAVVFGGRSAEHEISLLSARFVFESLDRDRFEPVLIGIDKSGRWLLQEEALLLGGARDPRLARLNQARPDVALAAHPTPSGAAALAVTGGPALGVDVVFPVLHGPMGEDGCVQGLLELAGVPYVGAGVLGSSVGMDKDVMKRLLTAAEIPILPFVTVRRPEWDRSQGNVLDRAAALGFPLFVKPANLGSSVGVRRVKTRADLPSAIDHAFEFDTKIVIEAGLERPREIECAVLGNDDPKASVAGEIVVDHPDGFYSYAAKYIDENGSFPRIPADLTPAQHEAVQALAIRTFQVLECAGLARVDFFLAANGDLFVNEINTIPGFTSISMYPKLWEASGVSARALVTRLIDLALERGAQRAKLRTST